LRVLIYYGSKNPMKSIKIKYTMAYTIRSRDNAVGIATGYGLDDQGVGVRVPVGARIFSSPQRQTGSGVHPASYPMGTGGSFHGDKAVRA
jgi:hypothetical protein